MVVDVLCRASTQGGAESQMNTATTLTTDHDRTIIAHKSEAVALQGNIIDRDAGMNGTGVGEDVSFTLNTVFGSASVTTPSNSITSSLARTIPPSNAAAFSHPAPTGIRGAFYSLYSPHQS